MRTLTDYQKEFLLEQFFKNEQYAGWKNIATALLETGECIVAGDKCIWIGYIGNFIKTETAKNAFGCLLYKFDLEYFFSSDWYKGIVTNYLGVLSNKKRAVIQEYKEIHSINLGE